MKFIQNQLKNVFFRILLYSLPLIFCLAFYGQNVSLEKQWELYKILLNLASIVFVIVGAWIAVVYPNTLSSFYKQNTNNTNLEKLEFTKIVLNQQSEVNKFNKLIKSMIISVIILGIIFIIGVIIPVVKQIPFLINYINIIRGISYFALIILAIVQFSILVWTLQPAYSINQKFQKEKNRNKKLENKISENE